MFSSCRVFLGETLLTKNPENYAHRAYFIDLLSFDGFAKYTWLEGQGWYQDTFGEKLQNQTAASNSGFQNRRSLFLKDSTNPLSEFSENGVIFLGRLHTDLVGAKCGLIPHLGLRIQLGLSSSAFVLQKPEADTATYQITISNATLFCPVGQLNPDAYRKLEHGLKTQDAKIYLQRSEVINRNIGSGGTVYNDQLFSGAPLPSRIFVAFVQTPNYLGTQTTSPYYFQRKFKIGQQVGGVGSSWFAGTSSTSGGQSQERVGQGTDEVFIEKVTVKLNGEQVDGLEEGLASLTQDTENYIRLHLFLGLMQSTTGNNVTLNEFHQGFFILAYDLTTSFNAVADYVIPAVRQGNLQIQVNFSGSCPVELTMLVFAEYPTLVKIDQYRQISISY